MILLCLLKLLLLVTFIILVASMDEKPKCSHTADITPIKQQPTEKDQSESQKDLLNLPEELTPAAKTKTLLILPEELNPAAKTQPVLLKELPASSEVETSPETEPALIIGQPIYLMEKTKFSKDQLGLLEDQPAFSKNQSALPEDQLSHSRDQRDNPKDQPTFSKTEMTNTMDKKPKCSHTADITIIKQQPTQKDQSESKKDLLDLPEELTPATKTQNQLNPPEELTPAAKTQTLLILPEDSTPVAKTQTVLLKDLPAFSEVETSPKTLPALTIDQPIYFLMEQTKFSKDQPGFSGDQPAFSKDQSALSEDQPLHSKDQRDNSKNQPTFSKTQMMNTMDEKPKCSHTADITPIKQQPTEKDQSESQNDLLNLPEELTPATKTQTVLLKELPASSEVETSPKTQPALTMDQPIYCLMEQTIFSKDQPGFSGDQPTFLKDQSALSEDQPLHSKDQWDNSKDQLTFSKTQMMNTMDEKPKCSHTVDIAPIKQQPTEKDQSESQKGLLILPEELTPAGKTQNLLILPEELTPVTKIRTVLLKELSASSEVETSLKTQPDLAIDQSIYLMEQTKFSKDQPGFSGDQTAFSKNQPAFSEDQPTFSKTQKVDKPAMTASLTKIYIDSTKDGSASSREFIVASKKQIDKSKGESSLTEEQKTLSMTKYTAASGALSCNINKDHFLSTNAPLRITSSTQSPKTNKPKSQLPVTATLSHPPIGTPDQPLSLFLQALSKLNESSLALSVLPFGLQSSPNLSKICNVVSGDITPPDSLASAPPTYSFVLRQMAVRRRPRFMGTFFPSPSFVQHAPPPTYTGAFDVYIEPTLPPPPARVYNFGFTSMPVVCSECGFTGMTLIKSRVTICTHLCAITLCLLCCWICAPLPYILSSCKDVYHYCRNCRTFLGMYCPTNPEAAYSNV